MLSRKSFGKLLILALVCALVPITFLLYKRRKDRQTNNPAEKHARNVRSVSLALEPLKRVDIEAAAAASETALFDRQRRTLMALANEPGTDNSTRGNTLQRLTVAESSVKHATELRNQKELELSKLLVAERQKVRSALSITSGDQLYAVRAATFRYAVFIRRKMGGSLHTEVPRLMFEPRCAGDLLRERSFNAYFEAVANEEYAEAAAILAVINSQLSCLSTRQVARLEQVMVAGLARAITLYSPDNKQYSQSRLNFVSLMNQIAAGPMFLLAEHTREFKYHSKIALQWFELNRAVLIRAARNPTSLLYHAGLPVPDRVHGRLGFVTSRCQIVARGAQTFRGRLNESYLKFSDGQGGETCNALPAMLVSTGLPCSARDWVAAGSNSQVAEAFTCAPSCGGGRAKQSADIVKEYSNRGAGLPGLSNTIASGTKYHNRGGCSRGILGQGGSSSSEGEETHDDSLTRTADGCGENAVESRLIDDKDVQACLDNAAAESALTYRSGYAFGAKPGGKCQVSEEEEPNENPPPPLDPDEPDDDSDDSTDTQKTEPEPAPEQEPDTGFDPNFGNPAIASAVPEFEAFLKSFVTPEGGTFERCDDANCAKQENLLEWQRGEGESKEYVFLNKDNMRWAWVPARELNVPGLFERVKSTLSNTSKQPKGTTSCNPDAMNCGSCTTYDANMTAVFECIPGYEDPDFSKKPKYPEGYDPKLGPLINPITHDQMVTNAQQCTGGGLFSYCAGAATTLCAEDKPNCTCPGTAPTLGSTGQDCTRTLCGSQQAASVEGTICTCERTVNPEGTGGSHPPGGDPGSRTHP
jgi:hypothetical protein